MFRSILNINASDIIFILLLFLHNDEKYSE